jgi:hypothetical protein
MNGKWKGLKAIETMTDGTVHEFLTEDEIKYFLNQYYQLEIRDCSRIILNINDNLTESSFEIKDGYMYMDMVYNNGEYDCIPYIDYLDEDEMILTIVYDYSVQEIYFQREN